MRFSLKKVAITVVNALLSATSSSIRFGIGTSDFLPIWTRIPTQLTLYIGLGCVNTIHYLVKLSTEEVDIGSEHPHLD